MTILINCTGKFCYRHRNFQNTEAGGIFKSFIKFTAKHLCQSLFFNTVAVLEPAILLKRDSDIGVSCELLEAFKNTCLKIWKFVYESGHPHLSDKKLFWKCLENIQDHIWIGLQVISSVKQKIGWIHIMILKRYRKTSKISSRLYFS